MQVSEIILMGNLYLYVTTYETNDLLKKTLV